MHGDGDQRMRLECANDSGKESDILNDLTACRMSVSAGDSRYRVTTARLRWDVKHQRSAIVRP